MNEKKIVSNDLDIYSSEILGHHIKRYAYTTHVSEEKKHGTIIIVTVYI